MAKRFTDTNKWADEWFSELDSDMKIVWLFLIDNCSHAGVWKRSIKLLKYHSGTERTQAEIEAILSDRIYIFDNDKWFIPKFLKFQYPQGLASNKPVILSVKEELKNYGLIEKLSTLLGNSYIIINQSLDNGSITIKDKDKYKSKDKDKDNTKEDSEVFKKIKHLSITKAEYNNLLDLGYTAGQIENIFNSIENFAGIKKYASLNLTAQNWLKREYPEVTNKPEAKIKPIQPEDVGLGIRKPAPIDYNAIFERDKQIGILK